MDRLQAYLPAAIMLPPKRLMTLLNQAAEFQTERCLYHNKSVPVNNLFDVTTNHYSDATLSSTGMLHLFENFLFNPLLTIRLSRARSFLQSEIVNHFITGAFSTSACLLDPSYLAVDHQCSKQDFPCETIQTLTDHCEEVWYCQFSPDGRKKMFLILSLRSTIN